MFRQADLSRVNRVLMFAVLTGVILYFGREFFVIIIFSGFLAMLMTPLSNRMEKKGVSRVMTSLLAVMMIILVIAGVIYLLSSQVANISDQFPKIQARLEQGVVSLEMWINNTLGIDSDTLKTKASEAMSNAGGVITGIVKGTFSTVGGFVLVLVFTFLFLLQREKYENFAVMLHREEKRTEARKIISRISHIAQQYLTGRLISIVMLGILYMVGFSVIGLENALLLASIAAIMTFIPYIGPFLGGFVPFFMALVGGDVKDALWVVAIIALAQVFDNYFIEPYVVGGSVNISPFFTIFILILGGVLWGIAGVILFLPLLGILRIIFENVEGMQPYAYLIGDQKKSSPQDGLWSKVKGLFGKK